MEKKDETSFGIYFILLSYNTRHYYALYIHYHNEFSYVLSNILYAAAAKLLQSCLTLCDPIDGSPPGSPVPGIALQYSCLANPMDGGAW